MGWTLTTTEDDAKGSVFSSSSNLNLVAAIESDESLKQFQEIYLGALSSDPSVTAYGTQVSEGMLYFNTTNDRMEVHDGNGFVEATPGTTGLANIQTIVNGTTGGTNNLVLINSVANDATDIGAVAAKATEIGRLGTADAVADLAILGTNDVVADMNTLAHADVVNDMNTLAHADVVNDMNTLATSDIVNDMNTLATTANVNNMATLGASGVVTNIADVAAKVTEIGRLGTTDAVADMAILGTTDVVNDMNILATTANVNAMNLLGTSAVVTDMGMLATTDVISDMNALANADVIADMNTLATSDIISDLNTLATSDIVTDMNLLATSSNVTAMANLGTSTNVTNMANLNGSGVISNISTVATNINGVNSFAERYRIGSSDPGSSNDAGDLFYNSTSNVLKYYDGSSWLNTVEAVTATNRASHTVSATEANAGTVTVSVNYIVNNVDIFVNGVRLAAADYTASNGTSVTITGLVQNDIIDIIGWSAFNVANALTTTNNLSDLASVGTARTNLGLVIGTDVQANDAGLTSIAGLTTAADKMLYTTGSDTYAVTTLTSTARSLLDDASTSDMRTTLGLGSMATADNNNIALAGNPTTTTQATSDNSTKIATTAYVNAKTASAASTDDATALAIALG